MKLKFNLTVVLFALITCVQAQKITTTKEATYSRQPAPDLSINSLKVGEKVPDLLIAKIINNDKRSAKISDFKNQLLILDFWDTYCGSCIEALPKLDSMQKKFGNKIKIMAVTYQKEDEVTKFFNTNRFLKGLKPPCVVEDNVLRNYFKHKIISHEVWIYKGVVVAMTTPEYVNAKNIQYVLDGKPIYWPVKRDATDFDDKKPMFALLDAEAYNQNNDARTFSGLVGYRAGIDPRGGIIFEDDSVNHVYRTAFYNLAIVRAFRILNYHSDGQKNFVPSPGRLVLEVKDSTKYLYSPKFGLKDTWIRENQFCYEMVSSKATDKKDRAKKVIQDLSLKLGLNVRWEKRMVNCIVIYKANLAIKPDTVTAPSKGTMRIVMSAIPMMWFDMSGKYPPAIDETGYAGYIYSTGDMRKDLQRFGFDYKEEMREIEVMVITENDYKKQ